jgi:hypothetical protein
MYFFSTIPGDITNLTYCNKKKPWRTLFCVCISSCNTCISTFIFWEKLFFNNFFDLVLNETIFKWTENSDTTASLKACEININTTILLILRLRKIYGALPGWYYLSSKKVESEFIALSLI